MQHRIYTILCLVIFLTASCKAPSGNGQGDVPPSAPEPDGVTASGASVLDTLNEGKVSLTLEGIDAGKQITLTVRNLVASPLVVRFPKGQLDFDIGTSDLHTLIRVSLPSSEIKELGAGKSASTTFPQTGKTRLRSGKVILKKTADGMSKSFENLSVGAGDP